MTSSELKQAVACQSRVCIIFSLMLEAVPRFVRCGTASTANLFIDEFGKAQRHLWRDCRKALKVCSTPEKTRPFRLWFKQPSTVSYNCLCGRRRWIQWQTCTSSKAGGRGNWTREKIVQHAADEVCLYADESKLVKVFRRLSITSRNHSIGSRHDGTVNY